MIMCEICENIDDENLSECCGASINSRGLCSDCKEHCE